MMRSAIHLLKPLSTRTDRELLADYLAGQDEQTFAELARRHTGMIRRIAADLVPDLADDVTQATFVLFQKKAPTIADRESAAGWLCQTARRLALKARTSAARRRTRETSVARKITSADPVDELSLREVRAIVVEELNALPESLRLPLLLVYWEGSSQLQAGSRLGCSLSTLKRRLDEGRDKLALRLKRRGFAPSAVLTVLAATAAGSSASSHNGIGIASPLALELAKSSGWTAFAGPLAATIVLVTIAGAGIGAGFMKADDPKPNAPIAQAKPIVVTTPQAPVDTLGDPIPANALVRLGSNRLRGNRVIMFPDGKRIAREVGNGNLQISEIPSGKPLAVIRAKDVPERDMIVGSTVGFTPDGKRMAAVCWKGRCGIWDTESGRLIRWVECSFYSMVEARFSPDGRYLAVGFQPNQQKTEDFKVLVYDLQSGEKIAETDGCVGEFSKDGKSLTAWNSYNVARTAPNRITIPNGAVISNAKSVPAGRLAHFQIAGPDREEYYEVLDDNRVACRNLITGEQTSVVSLGLNEERHSTYLLTSNRAEAVVLISPKFKIMAAFNPKDGGELWRRDLTRSYVPSLLTDGRTIVIPETDRTLSFYDMKTGKRTKSPQLIDNGQRLPREFTPDGRYGITESDSIFASAAVVWDMATGKPLSEVPGHTAAIMACSFSRDGRTAFTASDDNSVRVWDTATGKQQLEIRTTKPGFIASSNDGNTIYVASRTGTIESFDAKTGKRKAAVKAFATALAGMALSDDGKQLIAAGRVVATDAGSVNVFDPATLKEIRSFDLKGKPCEQMTLRPDGKSVAVAHEGRTVSIWDPVSGQQLSTWTGSGKRISAWVENKPTPYEIGSLTLAANGRWLAFSDQEMGIHCVSLTTGKSVGHSKTDAYYQTPAARYELSDALAFSPDGRTIAYSGSESSTKIYLIDVRTREIRRTFTADNEQTRSLAWSPDGTKLLSAGADGTAIIWNVNAPTGNATPVAEWWTKLATDKPADAEGLMAEMIAKPTETLTLLKQQLMPVAAIDSDEVGKLIAALDAADFDEREKATKQLHAIADQARNQLKDAHRAIASAEVKNRLQEVLDGVDETKPLRGDRLRFSRAIELLERINNAEAKTLLTTLATGAAEAHLTVDAAESLTRMVNRR
jgi:RNA polymerase sigma factor (sigma-70 family)